jgi:DNA-binding PadR family transcriptional regulator
LFYVLSNMTRGAVGELEFQVLLSVMHLDEDAYGAAVRRDVSKRAQRDYSVGAIYSSLERLEQKGLLSSSETDPLPVRGGRARRRFKATAAGRAAMRVEIGARGRAWKNVQVAWRQV